MGRKSKTDGIICVGITDSTRGTAETNTVQINYNQVKINFKKTVLRLEKK